MSTIQERREAAPRPADEVPPAEEAAARDAAPPRGRPLTADGRRRRARATGRAGPLLVLWAVVVLDVQGLLWLSGAKSLALKRAVEQGVARAESRGVGEVAEGQVQKAIRDQRAGLRFWTALALIGDFGVEPLAPTVRAVLAATLLGALAALAGRPVGFPLALDECAAAQGYWVLGLTLQAALVFALPTREADASLALLLPPGTYRAASWIAWRQVDAFALLGWLALIRGGRRRGQVNLATAIVACSALAAAEAAFRVGSTLLVGSAMRLTLIPVRF
ncbi:hypothetical protein [Paludisphaera soli]|uniref:hypothetical protein n=1 Tax=Paludisphaera soli TaxID=2712865 RepID=UPI001F10D4BC|nr:hypothetical protein [Paludisphaera soli]